MSSGEKGRRSWRLDAEKSAPRLVHSFCLNPIGNNGNVTPGERWRLSAYAEDHDLWTWMNA
jgi:hypothetical protein